MKSNINKIFVLLFVFSILLMVLILESCESKNGPSDADVFIGSLHSKTWKITVASLDNQDVTTLFPNLTLAIESNKTYTTTNPVPPIWNASGSFTLSGTSPNYHLIRDEGINITVVELDTKLILEFQYDKALAGGRTSSVSGKYHFEFN
jgi:hypothetical protein